MKMHIFNGSIEHIQDKMNEFLKTTMHNENELVIRGFQKILCQYLYQNVNKEN